MTDSTRFRPDGRLDRDDLDVLTGVLALHEALDPTPPLLADLVLFSLSGHDLDAELATLVDCEVAEPVGARGVELARRITFSSDHLTVMISVAAGEGDALRVDGWAAPGGGLRAELRTDCGTLTVTCDASGRFAFDRVRPGMAQLTLHPTADSDPRVRVPVVTPAVNL